MATVQSEDFSREPTPLPREGPGAGTTTGPRRMHRIQAVRRQQGISLRTAARQLGLSIREAREQEEESVDLRLSDLYRWQSVLDVPLMELLADPGMPLSHPVMERARLVRLMKTATALLELAPNERVSRMTEMLMEQLVELMPELKGVGPWHAVGHRRSLEEYGRIVERSLPDDILHGSPLDSVDG
jgi:transcriptional regulator with XRE-family HTH domain